MLPDYRFGAKFGRKLAAKGPRMEGLLTAVVSEGVNPPCMECHHTPCG
jgi:hypothetical protein